MRIATMMLLSMAVLANTGCSSIQKRYEEKVEKWEENNPGVELPEAKSKEFWAEAVKEYEEAKAKAEALAGAGAKVAVDVASGNVVGGVSTGLSALLILLGIGAKAKGVN